MVGLRSFDIGFRKKRLSSTCIKVPGLRKVSPKVWVAVQELRLSYYRFRVYGLGFLGFRVLVRKPCSSLSILRSLAVSSLTGTQKCFGRPTPSNSWTQENLLGG